MTFREYLKLKHKDTDFDELLETDMPFLLCHAIDKLAEMVLMQEYRKVKGEENESKNN